ncbi:pentapeptide repeat-containing protein [Pedobacter sp. JY14-1]|uniref:pentapeptide repeat-containing protein n=1 Tax=Pedobacter sp. JY14-1 TaxID=3034151 RepID=UPI0023E139A2|nr:pentapeptide repeat-containing protein [Pedobacter sp. JY14-1]
MSKELINRWKLDEGKELLDRVQNALKHNIPLDEIKGLGKHNGRWDLRGSVLSTVENERTIGNKEHQLVQKFGTLKLKRAKLNDVDFSYANISYSVFQLCIFSNCVFQGTKAKELRIYASDFNNCFFEKVDLSYSFMNINIGKNAGSFAGCEFINCNLRECIYSFPVVDACLFKNCNLYATNFDGSRMKNVTFLGEVNSCWFKGYSESAIPSLFYFFNKVDPKGYPNKMINVDFSDSELIGVSFVNGIDLRYCKFPIDERYLLVKNLSQVYDKVIEIIEQEWEVSDKKKALKLIDLLYFNDERKCQNADLIDKSIMVDDDGSLEFGNKLFNLIKEVSKLVEGYESQVCEYR